MKVSVSFALGFLAFTATVMADGGGVLAQQQAGPWLITLFANPLPLRAGTNELGVLVQMPDTRELVRDADVHIKVQAPSGESAVLRAKHPSESSRQLYMLQWNAPSAGRWKLNASVERGGIHGDVPSEVTVTAANEGVWSYLPYGAIVPAGLVLFGINRWLRSARPL